MNSPVTQLRLFDPLAPQRQPLGSGLEKHFDQPLAHRADAMSSYRAGDSMLRSGRVKKQMRAVLAAVRANPGSTSAELALAMGVDRHEPARRMAHLERRGLVKRGRLKWCKVCRCYCLSWWPTR